LVVSNLFAPKISTFSKFKTAAAAILKNRKNDHFSATVSPTGAKFGVVTHFGRLEPSRP